MTAAPATFTAAEQHPLARAVDRFLIAKALADSFIGFSGPGRDDLDADSLMIDARENMLSHFRMLGVTDAQLRAIAGEIG